MLPVSKISLLASLITIAQAYSPSGGYGPAEVSCPDDAQFVRAASNISKEESDWLKLRHKQTDAALKTFLERSSFQNFDVESFLSSLDSSINIGLAFSGGGYRAMLAGAGEISALDDRTEGATDHGLGGLLQASTYLAGLSGGNWLTGTLALNNWTSIQHIISQDDIWDLEHNIISSGGWNVFSTVSRWSDISDAVDEKEAAGYNTTITDLWGRALSYQFFDGDDGGASLTFSGIRDFPVFKNGSMPFPISVADGRTPGTKILNENSTVFEFNPFEMGSWDPSLYAFTDLYYLGTNVSNGSPVGDSCVGGFDNGGFVLGTSSSLFNQFILQLDNYTSLPSTISDIIEAFLTDWDDDYYDIALYEPNPFYETEYANVKSITSDEYLYLVDGGEDLQNVPLAPLIQPERNIDIIFAFDNSADTEDSLPNGASLVMSYERQFSKQGNGTSFPYVPGQNTFLKNGLTTKPTFFGCYSDNLTDLATVPPLVVYIANTPHTYWSNTSTFQLSYEEDEKLGMIKNGFETASRYNLTIDSNWQKCVSCAIIQRSLEREGTSQSDECKSCFDEYCWDGTYVTDVGINVSGNYTTEGDSDSVSGAVAPSSTSTSSSSTSSSTASSTASSEGGDGESAGIYTYGEPISKLFIALLVATLAALLV